MAKELNKEYFLERSKRFKDGCIDIFDEFIPDLDIYIRDVIISKIGLLHVDMECELSFDQLELTKELLSKAVINSGGIQ